MSNKLAHFPTNDGKLSKAVEEYSALAVWEPESQRLGREIFAQGIALIAKSHGKDLPAEAVMGFWIAVSDETADDFVAGVRLALRRERFITPAAIAEACAAARSERAAVARREREAAEAQKAFDERRERDLLRQANERAIEAKIETWRDPPNCINELRERVQMLLDRQGNISLAYLVRKAEWSGSVSKPVLLAEHGFFRDAARRLSDIASEAARHPVQVTVRDAAAPVTCPAISSEDEWAARRAELMRQADEMIPKAVSSATHE